MMIHKRKAFTMIELVFVIVVLGILAAIAVPKFAATRDDAHIAKARSTIAAVRSGIINERQNRLFRGDNQYINHIAASSGASMIFDNNGSAQNTILQYGVVPKAGSGNWQQTGWDRFTFTVGPDTATFDYNSTNGVFDCTPKTGLCAILTR